jgi:glycosyltransferase involved in cell wall biosynthesis
MTTKRPLVTLAVRFYNCEAFVEPALEAALAQTYSPLEVLVLDDKSRDGTAGVARRVVEAYQGPHRVRLLCNETNLGTGGQMERIRQLMSGEILVIADGDDVSLPHRVERLVELLCDRPSLMGADSYSDLIDENGRLASPVSAAIGGNRPDAGALTVAQIARGRAAPHGAVSAYRRVVLDAGTPMAPVRHSEDRILALRARLLGELATVPQVLVLRRVHANNISGPIVPSWTGRQLRAWISRDFGGRFTAAEIMRADAAKLAAAGRVAPHVAESVAAHVAAYRREAKAVRVASRVGACTAYRALRRLGVLPKESLRYVLTQVAPSLAMALLRRNPVIRIRH